MILLIRVKIPQKFSAMQRYEDEFLNDLSAKKELQSAVKKEEHGSDFSKNFIRIGAVRRENFALLWRKNMLFAPLLDARTENSCEVKNGGKILPDFAERKFYLIQGCFFQQYQRFCAERTRQGGLGIVWKQGRMGGVETKTAGAIKYRQT